MRNLKRALSLALASVMLLGMMVVGTSAASYPDVDENDNVEAIEVLNAVNVMIGRQGNFEPDEAVNRHEMAVIMAKLVLGNETADNYVGTHPFTDVVSWADKYVAACYENGLVAGTSATTFSGSKNLTAVEAAAMMLRALGYKDLSKGATDWRAPVTAMANQIRLFNGVASNPSEKLNRNQVAQLALNTLKSPVVNLKDNTFDVTSGDGAVVISGGSREYIVLSSREAYAYAINDVESSGNSASGINGATVELGEHLYNGKLRLDNDTIDDYGRPSRTWEYDGKEIGTYVRGELLRKNYTDSVKGKDMYGLLGNSMVNDANYTMDVYVDGWKYTAANTGYGRFIRNNFTRNNETNLDNTGRGVLTEVYVDSLNKEITVAIVNTYLAEADADYDATRKTLSVTVYDGNPTNKTLAVEDFPEIESVKDGDFMLINWADFSALAQNKVVTNTRTVEILSDKVVTQFSAQDNGAGTGKVTEVISDGTTYKSAATLNFDADTLDTYDDGLLTDKTYDIYLDQYGNAIGVDLHSGDDNYVFITGYDLNSSNIANRTATAAAIFLDGTMRTIQVDVKETNAAVDAYNLGKAQNIAPRWNSTNEDEKVNTWYTYTVDTANSTYTLRPIATQLAVSGAAATTIKSNSVRLQGPINGFNTSLRLERG